MADDKTYDRDELLAQQRQFEVDVRRERARLESEAQENVDSIVGGALTFIPGGPRHTDYDPDRGSHPASETDHGKHEGELEGTK